MKKEMRKNSNAVLIIFLVVLALLVVSLIASGWFAELRKTISGKVTSTVVVNITVGVPQIITVYNSTINVANGPNENTPTGVLINFSVYSPSTAGNLNHSTAKANITLANEDIRTNASCSRIASSGDYANYTCNVTMWWWDGTGSWNITAYIADNNTNSAQNFSTNFYVGLRTSFVLGPAILTWPGIAPGAINQTSLDTLLLNNTGNDDIALGEIGINATNLLGETTDTLGLWASNFSINWSTGGTPIAECVGTIMNASFYTNVTGANLTAGNYTQNNFNVGQEQLYFCLKLAGNELTTQPYSTTKNGAWTVRIL